MYQLYNDDCMAVMGRFADSSIDLAIADIPYGEVNRKSNGLRNLDKGIADTPTFDTTAFANEVARVSRGSVYVWCGTEQISEIRAAFVKKKLSTRVITWRKTNPSPMNSQYLWLSDVEFCVYGRHKNATFNGRYKSTVLNFPTVKGKLHSTQKNMALIKELILTSSNPGDTVLDPCYGSCTTGACCAETYRNFIGIELSTKYYAVGALRMHDTLEATCKSISVGTRLSAFTPVVLDVQN